jgi:hypothetical protein
MLIVTAADNRQKDILLLSQKNNIKVGYNNIQTYNLDGTLDFGIPFTRPLECKVNNAFGKIPEKSLLIKDAILRNLHEPCITYMDADAFAIRNFDEIEKMDDFDLGVTLRHYNEYSIDNRDWLSYVNAGVIFIKPSQKLIKFMDRWYEGTLKLNTLSDQHGLNKILLENSNMCHRDSYVDIDGIRIKFFPTEIYNWYYWPNSPFQDTKILHLKEHKNKKECVDYWAIHGIDSGFDYVKNRRDERGISGLNNMMDYIEGENLNILEVGSYAGESALTFSKNKRVKTVVCVDYWKLPQVERKFDENVKNNSKIIKIKNTSVNASMLYPDKSFDVIYIDANHNYEHILTDLTMWTKKTKRYIAGHDYTWKMKGVIQAVSEKFDRPHRVFEDGSWIVDLSKD